MACAVHAAGAVGVADAALVVTHQPADEAAAANDIGCAVGVADAAGVILTHQPADVLAARHTAADHAQVTEDAVVLGKKAHLGRVRA
ncbi:hypothetical protein D9M73_105420 [compost metagenome]